jgi:hypothetical protein
MSVSARAEIHKAAVERMRTIRFGDEVTNVCAGEQNPQRHSYFVRYKTNSRTAECTDKNGKFWETYIDVIFPGHLDAAVCAELCAPIWEAEHGKRQQNENV